MLPSLLVSISIWEKSQTKPQNFFCLSFRFRKHVATTGSLTLVNFQFFLVDQIMNHLEGIEGRSLPIVSSCKFELVKSPTFSSQKNKTKQNKTKQKNKKKKNRKEGRFFLPSETEKTNQNSVFVPFIFPSVRWLSLEPVFQRRRFVPVDGVC